jgi:hypothetical protein
MRYGLRSRKFGSIEAKTEDPQEKKVAREKRIKYYTLMVYEDADATLLRLFECFMESAPQLILQVRNMSQNVVKCHKMSRNVNEMSQNVVKCHKMSMKCQ